MSIPGWIWAPTLVLYAVLFVVDLLVVGRRPHVPTTAECLRWLGFYITVGVAFGAALWVFAGPRARRRVLRRLDHRVQPLGRQPVRLPADHGQVLRAAGAAAVGPAVGHHHRARPAAVFIALGAAVIERSRWVFYIFGAFLIYTAFKLASTGETDDDEYRENAVVRWVARVLPSTPDFHGTHLRALVDGKRLWTPMLVVLLSLGTTTVLFCLIWPSSD